MIFNQNLMLKTLFVHQSYSYILVKVLKSCVYKYYKDFYRLDNLKKIDKISTLLLLTKNKLITKKIIIMRFSVHCTIDTFV